uniref:NADH-ubiquinone oxidoreductase chain 3 n=1 Tax=Schistosoma japonicum TaxID=6182 RepID=A0A0U3JAQ4_SCHJA|nr:NADH dehydrogenase subunit 3 [Schistosoma japonicum]
MYMYFFFFFGVLFIVLVVRFYMFYYWGYKNLDYKIGLGNWVDSFECGFMTHGFSENFFSFSYLNLLVFFVIFDLEISLLLNIPFDGVWYNSFFCYMIFMVMILIMYIIEVYYGFVTWTN